MPPVIRKAARQPSARARAGTSSGTKIAPRLGAALTMPMARDRSLAGNQAVVVLMAAGVLTVSATARTIRAPVKWPIV